MPPGNPIPSKGARMKIPSALSSLAAMILLASVSTASRAPDFAPLVAAHEGDAIAARRWLHEHAELSLREVRTQDWIRSRLQEIPGIELVGGEWGTGLVAILRGGRPGPIVAYRADIDALPLTEATGLSFACQATDTVGGRTVGVMHACGHDLHAAVLLGTARVLSALRDSMPGSVLLIVEPGEEIGAGAAAMIQASSGPAAAPRRSSPSTIIRRFLSVRWASAPGDRPPTWTTSASRSWVWADMPPIPTRRSILS
jgi:hypothetical protein